MCANILAATWCFVLDLQIVNLTAMTVEPLLIPGKYGPEVEIILYRGDCIELLESIPAGSAQFAVTSPPCNIGKPYEKTRHPLTGYLADQAKVISQCAEILKPGGSICWEIGNHVHEGEVYPLDTFSHLIFKGLSLHLRNRVVWHYEHGLHSSR